MSFTVGKEPFKASVCAVCMDPVGVGFGFRVRIQGSRLGIGIEEEDLLNWGFMGCPQSPKP